HVRNHRSYWLVGTARERFLYGGASVIAIDWELRDPEGKVLGHQTAKSEVASAGWAEGDAEVAREAAGPRAPAIAKLVARNAPAPVEVPRPVLAVRGVTGAPGDGDPALAGAIAAALTQAHVELADGAGSKPETCILTGRVDIGPPRDGHQEVAVVWRVGRPDG